MEVMTYMLWVVLLMGSVMKNFILLASVPRSGQAMPAVGNISALFMNVEKREINKLERVFVGAVITNNQAFSWVDTS
ncbi:hypothetical protein KUV80_12205 [Fictibacillus nanhaiensis]|uniref:hypothetical protein n=1 Tax=Fictibacillus nanhaiensis TaxID=742169 RepID=UPI001C954C2A|nr:hypothetical protein [Fictibacillus nanhaiensis]MBY6037427.1 hypothetical protein [Fictibacillus nanhaiensis]